MLFDELLPIEVFGKKFQTYNQILLFFNKIWIIQISLGIFYCLKNSIYLPRNVRINSYFIFQLYSYFGLKSIIYLAELIFSKVFYDQLERFLHHIFAILIFITSILEPNVFSVFYLLPYFIHSIYWIEELGFPDTILGTYNISLLLSLSIIIHKTYNRQKKIINLKFILSVSLLFNVNLFGYFYGYNVNLNYLDSEKFFISIIKSVLVSVPFYLYLIIVNLNYSKINFCSTI